jgi:hypothetical protein
MTGSRAAALLAVTRVVAVAAMLGACGGADVMRPEAGSPDTGAHPVVGVKQAQSVLDAVNAAVARSAQAGDPAKAGARLTGPYREIMVAGQKVSVARKTPAPRPPALTGTRLIVPREVGWPRSFVEVGAAPEQATPVLRVVTSPDARTPYGLWGDLTMLPAAAVPQVAPVDEGAPALAADAQGFVASPQDVVAHYADVLLRDTASTYAGEFAPDTFRQQIVQRRREEMAGLKAVASTKTTNAVEPPVFAVQSRDGGAIVVAAVRQEYVVTIKATAGAVKVSDADLAALAGRSQFSRSITRTSLQLVAFDVPAAGGGPVEVIAATVDDVAVTGS